MTTTTTRRRIAAAVLAGASLLGLAACGDDEGSGASSTTAVDETPTSASGDAETVWVTAVDYEFEGLPAEVAAGTKLALANDAPSELHELVAIRLPDDEERSVEELMALPESELGPLLGAGPPAAVLLAAPGGEQITAVGDGTLAEPGRYLIMCSIPTGVAPEAYLEAVEEAGGQQPHVEGGPPHFVHGMAAELTVT